MNAPSKASLSANAECSVLLITRIQNSVARAFRMTRAELLSRRRTQRIACARQVAMYLCRDLGRNGARDGVGGCGWVSFPRVGIEFEPGPSSDIFACKTIASRRAEDAEFAQIIDDLVRGLSDRSAISPE